VLLPDKSSQPISVLAAPSLCLTFTQRAIREAAKRAQDASERQGASAGGTHLMDRRRPHCCITTHVLQSD